jgi:hypothetical protein
MLAHPKLCAQSLTCSKSYYFLIAGDFVKLIPFFAVLLAALVVQAQHSAMPDSANNDKVFNSLADQYFDKYYFKFNPSAGTAAGFHQYDTQLEDYSKASLDQQITTLKNFQKVIAKFDPLQLSAATREVAEKCRFLRVSLPLEPFSC